MGIPQGWWSRVGLVVTGSLMLLSASVVGAQAKYPTKPVRIIVPFPAGGGSDLTVRALAERLTHRLGQPIVIENRPGGAGLLGVQQAAKAPPDGYTLAFVSSSTIVAELMTKSPTMEQLIPITEVSTTYSVLVVSGESKIQSVADLLRELKARPGALAYGTAGLGTGPHLAVELMRSMSGGFDALHVPFKGGFEALPSVVSNQLQFAVPLLPITLPYIRNGKLRPLAVTTIRRFPGLPDVPTMDEAGIQGYDFSLWNGIAAPLNTPRSVIELVHKEVNAVIDDPGFQKLQIETGAMATGSKSPEDFRELWAREFARSRRLIAEANIKVE